MRKHARRALFAIDRPMSLKRFRLACRRCKKQESLICYACSPLYPLSNGVCVRCSVSDSATMCAWVAVSTLNGTTGIEDVDCADSPVVG